MPTYQQQWTYDRLDHMRQQADPPADALLQQLIQKEGKESARQLFDQLIRHIELPAAQLPKAIQQFIYRNRQLPDWANAKQIKVAEQLFLDHGPKFMVFLYYKSLPLLYTCKNGAQVLVQTGRLAHQEEEHLQFSRRIAETGQFLIDVMSPGGIHPNGAGIEAALKVRLIHASIRAFIPAEHWDTAKFGIPINQEDLALTLMTFGIALLDGLESVGLREAEDHQAAFVHFWNVVGYSMGIDESLLPSNPAEARWLMDKILERQAAPSEAGVLLTKALIRFAEDHLGSELLNDVPETLIRFLAGRDKAEMLGVTSKEGCWGAILPEFLKSAFGWVEEQEDHSLMAKLINEQLAGVVMRKMVRYFNVHKGVGFRVPTGVREKWENVFSKRK